MFSELSSTKQTIIGIIILILMMIAIVYGGFIHESYEKNISDEYMNTFDVELEGTIFYTEKGNSGGFEIICINVTKSNYTEFDQRDSLRTYYIIIKNNIAIIYVGLGSPRVNDVVKLNGNNRTIELYDETGILKSKIDKICLSMPIFFPRDRINELLEKYANQPIPST